MRLAPILLALCGICSAAQVPMGYATLTRALHGPPGLPGDSNDVVLLSSTACVAPPGLPTSPGSTIGVPIPPAAVSLLFIDLEAFRVNFVDSDVRVRVERAVEGTSLAAHAAGTFVWCGPASYFGINDPGGACNVFVIPVLPLVVIPSGQVWTCSGGQWIPYITGNSGGAILTFGAIQDGDLVTQTFSIPGVTAGDTVLPGFPATLETGLVGMMWVSAANTVKVALTNWSGATVTPAAQFFQATVGIGPSPSTAALTFPAISDGDVAVRTFSLPGATAGGVVMPGFPGSLETGLFGSMRVISTGLVEVRLANASGHTVTPAAAQLFMASYGATSPVGVGSGSLTYAAIGDGNIRAQSFAVTGAVPGTMTQPGWPPALETGLTGAMLVPSLNLVQSRLLNLSGASVTPAVQTFRADTF